MLLCTFIFFLHIINYAEQEKFPCLLYTCVLSGSSNFEQIDVTKCLRIWYGKTSFCQHTNDVRCPTRDVSIVDERQTHRLTHHFVTFFLRQIFHQSL